MKRKNEIKGICRGIAFVLTACLAALFLKAQPAWHSAVVGGIVGFCAYYGWQQDQDAEEEMKKKDKQYTVTYEFVDCPDAEAKKS